MTSPLTLADLKSCHLDFVAHIDASDWFGEVYRCIEHPRLRRIARYARLGKAPEFHPISWVVDGNPVAGLEEAVTRLNDPPVLTDDEKAALEKVGEEYADLRKEVEYRLLSALTDKGMIEFRDGKCRRRIEGRGR